MDENASSQDQDFSKLSIEDRLSHKNWKARVSGYDELARLFPQYEDKEFQRYAPLIKKFAIDTNAAAQEKALSAVLAFVDYCPIAGKYVENIVAGVATKCLTSTRAKTKELANDVVMMCVEIEKQDAVVDELIKALDQKTPKNVAATIAMLRKCLNQFGYKVINIKPIVPVLARLLEERDPSVRDEAKQLSIEIYRWIKESLVPQLSSLKPILLQELQVEFNKHKDLRAQPERLLRSQQQRQQVDENDHIGAEGADSGGDEQLEEEEDAEIDPFDLMEPVDILSKLPSDFYTLIEAKKWTERRDGLDKLHQLLTANPKLATSGDYGELIKQLRKIIGKDSNIVVATVAIKCMSLLANGLRKNFHNHANSSVPILLEKFKEKKANVVEALRESIDAVYLSTTMEAIVEDLVQALDNKNPSIRSETALFLARSFAKTNPNLINKKLLKTLTTSLIKTLSDPDAVVRESSAAALGTALKAQGERNMTPFLQGLEGLKMSKIEEHCANAEVKKFPNSAPAAAANKKSTTVLPSKPKTAPPVKKNIASKAKLSNHLSNESLNDDFSPPSTTATTTRSKPKIVAKSRLGINSSAGGANSDGASSISSAGSLKPGRSGVGINKTGSGSRLATLGGTKSGTGINHQSSSSLSAGGTSTTSGGQSSGGLASAGNALGGGGGGGGGSSSAKKQDLESGPLMNGSIKAKEQRFADEKALKVLKWNFTTPREEFYQLLREQMTNAEWQPLLVTYCYHSDFKYHIKAIDLMREFFQKSSTEENPVVVANLDLVLKWIALRFFDTNPSVITKALELLLVVFGLCEQHQYMLNDMEANSFIPYLVLKVGDPKDAVRNKVHEILARMRNIYGPNKIFAHLFTGLQSKNARQRATCLEEISQLIELRGMSIFHPPNSLQLIKDLAKFIAERDNGVRNGALSCIVQVYFLEGERVFKLIGSLSDKEMSLVEERIKRASKNRPPPPAPSQQNQPPVAQQHSHSASHLPMTEASNGGFIPSALSSPHLASAAVSGGSRLPGTTQFAGKIPTSTDLNNDGTFGLSSKLQSLSILPGGHPSSNQNSPQHHDIGATFSKSRSASSLLKRGISGGNFQLSRPSGLPQTPELRAVNSNSNMRQQMSPRKFATTTSEDTESDENQQNYLHTRNNGSFDVSMNNDDGHMQSGTEVEGLMDTQNENMSSDIYSTTTTEDDELDLKVKQALNLPEIKLVRRYRNSGSASAINFNNRRSINAHNQSTTSATSNGGDGSSDSDTSGVTGSPKTLNNNLPNRFQASPSINNAELNQKFAKLFQQLSSTDLSVVLEAMEHLNTALKDYEKYVAYLEPKIDQLIILCNKQFRLFLSKHYPEACEETNGDMEDKEQRQQRAQNLFRSTASVLNKLFRCQLGKKVSRDTLRELITHLLTYFAEMRHLQPIFHSVNVLIGIVLTGSDSTNLFSALIRMLHDYVGNSTVQHSDKFLEITMKFLWRVTKMLNRYMDELNVDQILYESHLFFKSYPRNWWKMNNRDDLPLRTIKTLIYYIVGMKGDSILDHFTLIKNKDESELWYYVQKALRQCDKSSSSLSGGPNHSASGTSISNVSTKTATPTSIKTPATIENNDDGRNAVNGNPKIDSLPLRTSLKNFPLKVRQINNMETGSIAQIPIIQNQDDLKTYIDYTAKQLNIEDELNWENILSKGNAAGYGGRCIRSVEDATLAVDTARQRLDRFRAFLKNDTNAAVGSRDRSTLEQ